MYYELNKDRTDAKPKQDMLLCTLKVLFVVHEF